MRIKITGAGSIGNHMAHAARKMNWEVDIVDIDPKALERTKKEIYPTRYGKFDNNIKLFLSKDAPSKKYEIIFIGTPPDTHMDIALSALEESPKVILVEKPFCKPDLQNAMELFNRAKSKNIKVFVGYNHVVGKAASKIKSILENENIGKIQTLDVEFREHWEGIFSAHHWLDGPRDSYLGYWERGGGASSEHSHAANLWQFFANITNIGRIIEVTANLDFVINDPVNYDKICIMTFKTESGVIGRCVQDVLTKPARKWARIQGDKGFLEWDCGSEPGLDRVYGKTINNDINISINKTRPDDFIEELKVINSFLQKKINETPIDIERGLETSLVIAAALKSNREKKTISINYKNGYKLSSLS